MNRKKICIISFSKIRRDGRVLREIEFSKRKYDVTVIGFGDWDPPENVSFVKIERNVIFPGIKYLLLLIGRFYHKAYIKYFWLKKYYKDTLNFLLKNDFDLVHGNDWDIMPIMDKVKELKNPGFIFDAHDYFLSKLKRRPIFNELLIPYIKFIMSHFSGKIDRKITTSQGFADLYRKAFGWEMEVIRNAPSYQKSPFRATSPDEIKLIFHGHASRPRRLENLIRMMPKLDQRYSLYLMLVITDKNYYKKIRNLAAKVEPERVIFVDPVLPSEITSKISEFDLGMIVFDGDEINNLYFLPNKFFESMMAGLGICTYPLPEMKSLIEEYHHGVFPEEANLDQLIKVLNSLSSSEIDQFKRNSLKMAREINAEREMLKLEAIYKDLIYKDDSV